MSVKNDMVFELTHLKVFDTWLLNFWNVVTIHVHEDILNHNDIKLLLLPDFIDLFQEVVLTAPDQLLNHRLE